MKHFVIALLLFAGALGVGIPLARMNTEHREKYTYAFPDLQDARDVARAQEILRTWQWTRGTEAVRRAMQLDLAFPLFYATLLALLAWRASIPRTPLVARLGRVVAILAIFGGLADIAENTIMLTMLGDATASRLPVMLVFTHVKIAGILFALIYLLFAHLNVNEPDATASDVPLNT